MAALGDAYAPEHLELQTREDAFFEARLTNYGSLFVGPNATVAYGDKAIGVNHVLPTGRAARYTGGLWVGKFLKTLTYQRLTDEGTARIAPVVAAICDAELMPGHALTARMRLARAGRVSPRDAVSAPAAISSRAADSPPAAVSAPADPLEAVRG
jgi:sulfopropanediol 3-dehydrogenase